jgi:hypothetical protein
LPQNSTHTEEKKNLMAEVRLYVEKRVQLFSLTLAEQLSLIIAHSFQKLIGILLLSGAGFFFWFAVGFYLGELLDSYGLGFLISSIPLFIAGFLFVNKKSKKLTEKIQAELIDKAMKSVETSLNLDMEDENDPDKE